MKLGTVIHLQRERERQRDVLQFSRFVAHPRIDTISPAVEDDELPSLPA